MLGIFPDVYRNGGRFDHILQAIVRVRSQAVFTCVGRVRYSVARETQLHQVLGEKRRPKDVYDRTEFY